MSPTIRNSAAGREAVVDHLQHAALEPERVEREHPEHHEAEVADRGVRDQLLHVLLHERHEPGVHDRDDRERRHPGHRVERRLRQERQREADEAVGAHLQQHAGQDHRARGGRLDVGVGQPGVEREHRDLDREAQEEGQEHPELQVGRDLHAQPGGVVEAAGRRELGQRLGAEVEREDAEQHHHRAHERVEEELDRGVEPPRAAPDPDQEVHRDQHHLPEHVEQEHVERAEDTEHPGLEQEQEHVVAAHALADGRPRGQDRDRAEQRREQDQERRDPVDAEQVLDADRGDPGRSLDELEVGGAAVEPGPKRQADEEAQEPESVRHPAHGVLSRLAAEDREHQHERAHERGEGDHGEQVLAVEIHVAPGWPPSTARARNGRRRSAGTGRSAC